MRLLTVLLFTTLLFSDLYVYSQNIHEIIISIDKIYLEKGGFYIDDIHDLRENKADIGFVRKGFFNKEVRAQLSGGMLFTLKSFFNYNLSKSEDKSPINVKVLKFQISELTEFSSEYALVDISLAYYYGTTFLYKSVVSVKTRGLDVTKLHAANITTVLTKSLRHFDRYNWEERRDASDTTEGVDWNLRNDLKSTEPQLADISPPVYPADETQPSKSRNATTIGYQIGGFSLVGLDYEVRVSDYFGIHFGGGFAGYTAGLKIHTNDEKSSPFFNLNYKDGGFGLIKTAGVEFGARLPFFKNKDFGLHVQAGIGKILRIDPGFSKILFKSITAPAYIPTIGVGFGW